MIFFLRSSKHFNKLLTTIFITINIAINWVIGFMSSARVLDFIRDIYWILRLLTSILTHYTCIEGTALPLSLMTGSFAGVLLCHTSDPSKVSSWKLLLSLLSSKAAPLLSLGLGGGAGGDTLVTFFGLGRVGGGCFLMVETSEWSLTGSSSGMAGSGGEWPLCVWPLVRLRGEGAPAWK